MNDQQRDLSRVSSDYYDTELARRPNGETGDRPSAPSRRNGSGRRCGKKCGFPCVRGRRLDHRCKLASGRRIYCDVSLLRDNSFSNGHMEGEMSVQNSGYYIMQLEKELRVPPQASPRFNPSHA